MIDGACDLDRQASGDVRLSSPDGGRFGDVVPWGEGEADGAWNGAFGNDHAGNVMGPLVEGTDGRRSNALVTIGAR